MLSVKNITFKIHDKILLDDVSVIFEPGKLNLIIGPNGAGKSTLIKALCNQITPLSGSISLDGKDIKSYSPPELGRIRSVLSQNIDLVFPLKVWEVVMMGRYPHFIIKPTKRDEQICEDAMQFFDVSEFGDRNYMTLSGGEKQRVHFARVMAQIWDPVKNSCRYLIMDEPLTFLDIYYQFQFMHKVEEILLAGDIVVIGVVHDLNLAARFADKIVLINNGKILAQGANDDVLTLSNIKTAYQLTPIIIENKKTGSVNLFFD
ncbi:MAG TPA: heme ABC transporter ATP-binding protein [Pedobacter sp.]|uniref:heme ABC transporter ATP-binding protein n=1 Tax=Pedobacter sp. TaxID=1411316 RepID=UPI002CD60300|nr:heme ABC transporter ATP-binding protein [Pedobacter sp.]HMI02677.1 heme ABC transporter ATP-binding protein [Pedobacter sp.]